MPGALHHIMQRGMERGRIFRDEHDYEKLVKRMRKLFELSETPCFAWSLMPNHIHLLLSTGNVPVSKVLHRLFCGHAVYFNHRHGRSGHLFQGRYKSILCETETYLLELVRYIHLNPVRTGPVEGMEQLAKYEWTGHREILGKVKEPIVSNDKILSHFGRRLGLARKEYTRFIKGGLGQGTNDYLEGNTLNHLVAGGWEKAKHKLDGTEEYGDERILGSRIFVEEALKKAGETERWRSKLASAGLKPSDVLQRAAKVAGLAVKDVVGNGKRPSQCLARILACKWLVDDLGQKEVAVARLLGITQPSVSINVMRGRMAEIDRKLRLAERGGE